MKTYQCFALFSEDFNFPFRKNSFQGYKRRSERTGKTTRTSRSIGETIKHFEKTFTPLEASPSPFRLVRVRINNKGPVLRFGSGCNFLRDDRTFEVGFDALVLIPLLTLFHPRLWWPGWQNRPAILER